MHRIGVVKVGGPQWPRYALHDATYQYWTGSGWSAELKGAMLFADERATAVEFERVVGLVRAGQPVREYTCVVTVRVVGREQYEPDRLQHYLSAACRLHLDPDTLDGPAPDAAVTIEIEWVRLREHDRPASEGA